MKLHPAAIAVWLVEDGRRLGLGLIPLLAIGGRVRLLLLAGLVFAVIGPVARWLRFSYRTAPGSVVVEGGVVNRWRRTIPAARVQSIDIVQKLRHRAFGVVELRIEVAGGSGTEAALVALTPEEAERVRRSLSQEGAGIVSEAGSVPVLVRLTPRDLVLAGLTGGRVAIIAVLLGYLQQLAPDDFISSAAERLVDLGVGGVWLVLSSIAGFIVVAGAISLGTTVVTLWDFTVERSEGRLLITRGLLERRRSQVALHRLQAVTLQENLLRRALGLASVTVVVAGRAGPKEEQHETSLLLPTGTRNTALELIAEVLGADPARLMDELVPAPRAALWRRLPFAGLIAIAAGAAGVVAFDGIGVAAVVLGVPAALPAWAEWRALGHRVDRPHLVVRRGVLVRQTSFVALSNVQDLRLTVSPLQRPGDLATLVLGIPKQRLKAVDLERARAEASFEQVSDRLSSTSA
ncbi:MAG: PH domain-containing protein [Actinomycetota bacterium]|nr:PH domain-containing protein [Actinomycetota bacterium]